MTARWWLAAAFGPNEVAPQWPFLLCIPLPVVAAYFWTRRKAAA